MEQLQQHSVIDVNFSLWITSRIFHLIISDHRCTLVSETADKRHCICLEATIQLSQADFNFLFDTYYYWLSICEFNTYLCAGI